MRKFGDISPSTDADEQPYPNGHHLGPSPPLDANAHPMGVAMNRSVWGGMETLTRACLGPLHSRYH